MVWKLLYGKCTLNHLDTGKSPVQPLSRQTDIYKFTDPQQCISLCVFIVALLPSIHFSPSMTRGGGTQWQGSLHHKTPADHRPQQLPHEITDTLSTSKWTGPVWHAADTGRVRGKGRMAEREESQERWEGIEGMGWKGREIETKHHVAGLSSPPPHPHPPGVPNQDYSHWTHLTFVSLWPR